MSDDTLFAGSRVIDADRIITEQTYNVKEDGRITIGKEHAGNDIRIIAINNSDNT